MRTYEIWLKNKQEAILVKGDKVVIAPGPTADHQYDDYVPGDLLVERGGRVVAFYKKSEVRGYNEQSKPTIGIA